MARYDSVRKLQRNADIKQYQKEHPDLSLREIGQVFNISGARVWMILKKTK